MIQSHLRKLCAVGVLLGGTLLAAEPGPKSVGSKSGTPKPAKPPVDPGIRILSDEQNIYLQRLAYCTRLRQLALDTRDEKYVKAADELETMATEVYKQRTSGINVAGGSGSLGDLDKQLGSGATASSEASLKSRKPNGSNASASRGGN